MNESGRHLDTVLAYQRSLRKKDSTGLIRYLVARKGNRGVILFPLRKGPSDEELKKLAVAALSH